MKCGLSGVLIMVFLLNYAIGATKEDFIIGAGEEKVLRIGLVDCIMYVVKNNSEVRIERIEPQIAEQDIRIAKSGFHPNLELKYYLFNSSEPSLIPFLSGTDTSKTRGIDIGAGITGRLYTGTIYSMEFLNNWLKTNSKYQFINPAYESQAKITITQPLFKGAGVVVNKANILIATNKKGIRLNDLTNQIIETITQVKEAYYNYLFTIENCRIAKLSLRRARYLEDIIETRYKSGLSSSIELLEASSAVANRLQISIEADSLRENAEDLLKLLTNLIDDPYLWNAEIVPLDKPEFKKIDIDLVGALITAFDNRPDYKSAKIELENLDIEIKVAGNNLWPELDLVGSLGVNGLGGDYSQDWDRLISGDYPQWAIGVKASYPWLNVGGRASYEMVRLRKAQALIGFKRLEQKIVLDVRNRVRDVKTNYRKLIAARHYKQVQQKNFYAQRERFLAGQISTHDLLEYEEELAKAQVGYIRALIDYNIAIVKLQQALGVTLKESNICIE